MNKTKYSDIIYSRKGGVALLTIDRPEKLNAMSTTTISELSRAVMEADADGEIRVIVLTGSGGKAFSAGFDIINVEKLSVMESRRLHIRNSALNKALMETGKPDSGRERDGAGGGLRVRACFATLPSPPNRLRSACRSWQ